MTNKKLVYFSPVCEWNDFVGFNAFLFDLKKKENIEDLTVVVPNKAKSIITEATRIITISDSYLDNNHQNYPEVLEINSMGNSLQLGSNTITVHGRNPSNLFTLAYDYVTTSEEFQNHEIRFYEQEVNLYTTHAGHVYRRLFNGLNSLVKNNVHIKPTKETYERIAELYKNLFETKVDKTYLLLTRNFKNKAPCENTSELIPSLEEIIKELVVNNIKIINLGFPVQPYEIKHENYVELNMPKLTQDELVCLMYCCDGVLLSGRSGGFAAHVLSNSDLFLMYEEWSVENKDINIEVFETRKATNLNVASENLSSLFRTKNISEIVKKLKFHTKVSANSFGEETPTIYLR